MIFAALLILIISALVAIFLVLHRIHEDIRTIRNWYCEDQK